MIRCDHVFKSKGEFYKREPWLLGGDVFTVLHHRECIRCSKIERKVVRKKRVTTAPDKFERRLRFSGIKPEGLLN